jgi:hypothetical protein
MTENAEDRSAGPDEVLRPTGSAGYGRAGWVEGEPERCGPELAGFGEMRWGIVREAVAPGLGGVAGQGEGRGIVPANLAWLEVPT